MSRPIKLTDELRQSAMEEFEKTLLKAKMADGKFVFNKSFTYKDDEKAVVYFTPVAFARLPELLHEAHDERTK